MLKEEYSLVSSKICKVEIPKKLLLFFWNPKLNIKQIVQSLPSEEFEAACFFEGWSNSRSGEEERHDATKVSEPVWEETQPAPAQRSAPRLSTACTSNLASTKAQAVKHNHRSNTAQISTVQAVQKQK